MQVNMKIPDIELMRSGHLACQGCGATIAMRMALKGLGKETVVVIPACCWSIIVGAWPHCALDVPVVHVPFETAAVVASGVRAALDVQGKEHVNVMAWAGDGGTFDIGLQALSGAAERNENIIYCCYDNEAYMNTGIQRSSATPVGAWTTTTPSGHPKDEPKKDIERILLGHHIPYIATTSVAYPEDFVRKMQKAAAIKGTRFIHILSPCPAGWKSDPAESISITRMATEADVFPIFEIENCERLTVNVKPERKIRLTEYLATQRRFSHLKKRPELVLAYQAQVDRRMAWISEMERATPG